MCFPGDCHRANRAAAMSERGWAWPGAWGGGRGGASGGWGGDWLRWARAASRTDPVVQRPQPYPDSGTTWPDPPVQTVTITLSQEHTRTPRHFNLNLHSVMTRVQFVWGDLPKKEVRAKAIYCAWCLHHFHQVVKKWMQLIQHCLCNVAQTQTNCHYHGLLMLTEQTFVKS